MRATLLHAGLAQPRALSPRLASHRKARALLARPRPRPPTCLATRDASEPSERERFFQSQIVQEEVQRMMKEWKLVPPLLELFPSLDLPDKHALLERIDDHNEREAIFFARLRLSDDPQAKHCLRTLLATLAAQPKVSWEEYHSRKRESAEVLRGLVELEIRVAGDPAAVERVRKGQAAWVRGPQEFERWAAEFSGWLQGIE